MPKIRNKKGFFISWRLKGDAIIAMAYCIPQYPTAVLIQLTAIETEIYKSLFTNLW